MTSSTQHMNTIKVTCGKRDGEDLTYQIQQSMNSKENSSEQLRMSTFWKELGSMSPSHARSLLANLRLMEGSAKIVSLIARDENQHLVITQQILNKWRNGDDPDMKKIFKEEESMVL